MTAIRTMTRVVIGAAMWLICSTAAAQVTINEYVYDERTAATGQVDPDTREFVELFNAGSQPVDISGWTLVTKQIGSNFNLPAGTKSFTLPASQTIPAGGYYVIGNSGVANVNHQLTAGGFDAGGTDFFPDGINGTNANHVLELRNSSNALIDALAAETFRGTERANLNAEQRAQVGGGSWGQTPSFNLPTNYPNVQLSLGRIKNGVDTDVNGNDFGQLPVTPGQTNNFPEVLSHTIPNVDGMLTEVTLEQNYYASFVLPRVVNPAVADGIVNHNAISNSPQGGEAIMVYDQTGGGNAAYSRQLVRKFDLYAYVETAGFGGTTNAAGPGTPPVPAADLQDSEATVYGIGTTDGFFGTPDPLNSLTANPNITSSTNGSTGVGWMIERVENFNNGNPTVSVNLLLIDFGDGGDGVPEDREWAVMKRYDLTGQTADWHRLSIEVDATTGVVTAKHGVGTGPLETTTFKTAGDYNDDGVVDAADYVLWRKGGPLKNESATYGTNTIEDYNEWKSHFGEKALPLLSTFFVGYRENIWDVGDSSSTAWRPPTFDMIGSPGLGSEAVPEPSAIGIGIACVLCGAALRRRSAV
jgi:hypothetical protein